MQKEKKELANRRRSAAAVFCIGLMPSPVPHDEGLLAFQEIKFTKKKEKDFVTICGRNPKEREGLNWPG